MRRVFYLFFVFALSIILLNGCKSKEVIFAAEPGKNSPDNINTANQQGKAEDYDKAVAKHYSMQSKSTQEMMDRTAKRNKKVNYSRNRKWYDRFFNNSCNSSSCMIKTKSKYHSLTNNGSPFVKK